MKTAELVASLRMLRDDFRALYQEYKAGVWLCGSIDPDTSEASWVDILILREPFGGVGSNSSHCVVIRGYVRNALQRAGRLLLSVPGRGVRNRIEQALIDAQRYDEERWFVFLLTGFRVMTATTRVSECTGRPLFKTPIGERVTIPSPFEASALAVDDLLTFLMTEADGPAADIRSKRSRMSRTKVDEAIKTLLRTRDSELQESILFASADDIAKRIGCNRKTVMRTEFWKVRSAAQAEWHRQNDRRRPA